MSTSKQRRAPRRPRYARIPRPSAFLPALWLACSPGVGSEAWCEKMKETPKADWSTRETADFTKHCIFN